MSKDLPRRQLGRTGFDVSVFALGGVMYNHLPDDQAVALVRHALDMGVNYIDTAAGYEDSERKIGLALAGRHDGVYIATKASARGRDEAMADIERSLERLGVDTIDCLQIHDLGTEEELAEVLGPNGAMKAIEEFKSAGQIRFVGVTGHRNPEILARAMREYDFDTLLTSLGATHAAVRPFYDTVIPVAIERGVGVLGMKVMTFALLKDHAEAALRYVLGLEGVAAAVVGVDDIEQLEKNLAVVRAFEPLTGSETTQLLETARALYCEAPNKVWSIHQP